MRSIITSLVVSALALLLYTADAGAGEKKFEKKFTVSPGGTLSLGTDVGSVKIIGSSSNEVSIVAEIRGRDRDVREFDVSAEHSGNNVEIVGKLRKGGGWFWNSIDLDVEFTIKVPHEFALRLNTSGGNIVVSDLKGTIKGETSGGNIGVNSIEGEVDLGTSGGNVHAEKCTGKIHMETSGGDVHVTTITGDVDVSTSGGNVKVSEVEGKVRAETSGGNVAIKVRGTNKGVHAETSGGNIDIFLPRNINANLDAATSGGEVQCDMPVTMTGRIDESRVKGTINGGGNIIYAHTSGGDVRIRAVD
ncbi:MAG: DUF4097 family beta strand repeat-containing protein [Bacteroidota bacterium]